MPRANNKKEITKNTAIDLVQVTAKDVESRMILLRNQLVLIDSDVAELYGVQTKEVNQAVRNNPQKFPYGYIFELNKSEKDEVVKNFDHLKKWRLYKTWRTEGHYNAHCSFGST